MSCDAFNEPHTTGRSGWPKIAQRLSSVSWRQRTPAGLLTPLMLGMPGMGVEMEGAMQQAPQPGRQFMIAMDVKAMQIRQRNHGEARPVAVSRDAVKAAA